MKLSLICVVAILVASSTAFAQSKNYNSSKSNTSEISTSEGATPAVSAYIHRPDSTQYRPGGQKPEAGAAGENPAPAATGSQYVHRPDSTQYHPGGQKDGSTGGTTAEDDWETPVAGKAYVHRPDSTQYHPGGKEKGSPSTD